MPSSPRPCPISPSKDNSCLLPMDEDFIDLSSFIEKENKKPFSPARKRLNMDALATSSNNSPVTKNILQQSNLVNISSPLRPLKRQESSLLFGESPVQNKRHKSGNDHVHHQPQHIRKSISIMNVLTSSSENLRKNRLWDWTV